MTAVMILAPPRDDVRVRGRKGDAFDIAFTEILRTLDGQGDRISVLAPWSPDLAPLVAIALVDTVPRFDPESGGSAEATRSRIIPYRHADEDEASSEGTSSREAAFWGASHLSLARPRPVSLAEAVAAAAPTHLVVLGLPKTVAALKDLLGDRLMSVVCFRSLVEPGEVAEALGVDSVVDLERKLPPGAVAEAEDWPFFAERTAVESLESYVPYGLLLQDALDEFLPGDEREGA